MILWLYQLKTTLLHHLALRRVMEGYVPLTESVPLVYMQDFGVIHYEGILLLSVLIRRVYVQLPLQRIAFALLR
jgi:hypothetical protein